MDEYFVLFVINVKVFLMKEISRTIRVDVKSGSVGRKIRCRETRLHASIYAKNQYATLLGPALQHARGSSSANW